ncbi:MAG: hypothetical protein U9R74_10800 [Pseudomonadota bacterium]|nr:hypothetical protein [Pseudomonadota bacterium]
MMMKTVPVLVASVVLGMATAAQADAGLPRQADSMVLTQHQMDTVTASGIGVSVEAAAVGVGSTVVAITGAHTQTTAGGNSSSGGGYGYAIGYGDEGSGASVNPWGSSNDTDSFINTAGGSVTAAGLSVSWGAVNGAGVSP